MKRYLDENDRYKAFLVGQRCKEDDYGQSMSRNLLNWSKSWERQDRDCQSKDGMPRSKASLSRGKIVTSHRKTQDLGNAGTSQERLPRDIFR